MEQPASQFVQACEQWRGQLGLSHTDFLRLIGRVEHIGLNPAQTEWASMRAGRRGPSQSFIRGVRRAAAERDRLWLQLLDAAYQQDALAKVA